MPNSLETFRPIYRYRMELWKAHYGTEEDKVHLYQNFQVKIQRDMKA
ncbi:hypothetical protein bsdE14_18380 [Clostridium omnivorum]|uniref:Uncharacterized protein n=1 Tax=Clostridium omnivorum TaxID=1604902 RepID=A0ABQ5N5C6_9CLOT|nr:hypothetical protein bsdE14_18380 [Clostridium sp. E14]